MCAFLPFPMFLLLLFLLVPALYLGKLYIVIIAPGVFPMLLSRWLARSLARLFARFLTSALHTCMTDLKTAFKTHN